MSRLAAPQNRSPGIAAPLAGVALRHPGLSLCLQGKAAEICYAHCMPGCCLGALLLFFGPRVVLFSAWLFADWYRAFDSAALAVVAWMLAPWTSLAWMYIHFHNAGNTSGGYIVLLAIAVLADLGTYGGSQHARRRQLAG